MKDAKLSQRTIPRQATFAKAMRRNMTEPERKLWKALRSYGAKIVIEVDRDQHGTVEARQQDGIRTASMEAQGYRVLRFSNRDVMLHMDIVLDTIAAALSITPTPNPSPQRGTLGGRG